MSQLVKKGGMLAVGFLAIFAIYQLYPFLLYQVMEWQKSFNQQISGSLHLINENADQAGWILLGVSFLYGVFHAVGPGHGKFILSSYLSLEQTKLPQAMRLTLLSALAQGLIAIVLVTIIVVLFTLSRSYFNQALQWIERAGFCVIIAFGVYWCIQAFKKRTPKKRLKIKAITKPNGSPPRIQPTHIHTENCTCGHQHLPSKQQLAKAESWKAQLMIIFSIGSRPCSGAILVLFLAYTLDLYWWGVFSTLAMSLGTGLTLSFFAYLVLIARQKAIRLSSWYLSQTTSSKTDVALKLMASIGLMLFGILMLHSSFIQTTTNILFKR